MEIKTVSIIGLGALGILYANHFTKHLSKESVRIIANQERINRYQQEGVYCNGEPCDFQYMTPEEPCEPADLVLFTVKYSGLHQAIKAIDHHVGEHTIILSALNGISSESIIANTYGDDKVLYCVAQGMDAVKEKNQLTYHHKGILCFGVKNQGEVSNKVKRVATFFETAELPYQIDTNMLKRQWGKFMLNVGVNQTVAVVKGDYGSIQRKGPAREMMIAAMREVIQLSEKEGVNLTEKDLHYWLEILSTLSSKGKPSMRQDLEAGRLSEVELFAGTVLTLAEKHGISTPVNAKLYNNIQKIENTFHG